MDRKLILASTSPRRKELLSKLGIPFLVVPSAFNEVLQEHKDPLALAIELAEGKARDVVQQGSRGIVIGGDTLISFEGRILGKPKSGADAEMMLQLLRGKHHEVITGICIIDTDANRQKTFAEKTSVWFRVLSDEEITAYVSTGEPLDKAGAYAIQGGARHFVEKIEGDFNNVMGLPLKKVAEVLNTTFGIRTPYTS